MNLLSLIHISEPTRLLSMADSVVGLKQLIMVHNSYMHITTGVTILLEIMSSLANKIRPGQNIDNIMKRR